ncbi:MAG: hypothetical protein A3G40_09875 [Deltaproteobacteria bacterium RIFCSPLOWO2_12_FULL_57_22]|nr:MAG: hypothetical protein A3G40_09875 [Deltaproteobacteria bacterium RIFCSPLOWO2_12_FULL_57_22]
MPSYHQRTPFPDCLPGQFIWFWIFGKGTPPIYLFPHFLIIAVNVARKLIASWEKRYEVSTAAETWKLKRIWSRELTGEQRAIFNLG